MAVDEIVRSFALNHPYIVFRLVNVFIIANSNLIAVLPCCTGHASTNGNLLVAIREEIDFSIFILTEIRRGKRTTKIIFKTGNELVLVLFAKAKFFSNWLFIFVFTPFLPGRFLQGVPTSVQHNERILKCSKELLDAYCLLWQQPILLKPLTAISIETETWIFKTS